MHIGGVQKALVNLLSELPPEYEITLLLFYNGGELLKKIPENVKVIAPSPHFRYWGMTKNDVTSLKSRAVRSFWAVITRIFGRGWALRLVYPFQKTVRGYDVAISFLHSGNPHVFYGGCNEFVLHCVEAEKKITFLHCDYGKIGAVSQYNTDIYRQFDKIAACSDGCRKAFLKVMPQFAGKTVVVQNCHNYKEIYLMTKCEPVSLAKNRMNIVTVSRFGKEKGILRAIRAVAQLGERAEAIRYYIIGDGTDYPAASAMISELGLSNTVFLLGEKENPYGYMRAADVLLIPSVSEAAPMVIGEAVSLGTPVLTTETSSAYEMVAKTGFGWVCANSVDGIRNGIDDLLSDPNLIQRRRAFIRTQRFDNNHALRQFLEMIL